MACTFGPLVPWDPANNPKRMKGWDSEQDVWELYHFDEDFSQANDLAADYPDKLAAMKNAIHGAWPKTTRICRSAVRSGRGFTPKTSCKSPYTKWTFTGNTRRMPEFTAPGLGKRNNTVDIELDV